MGMTIEVISRSGVWCCAKCGRALATLSTFPTKPTDPQRFHCGNIDCDYYHFVAIIYPEIRSFTCEPPTPA